uniref:LigA n=1 Tax=Parastrongyloides trichosuri TaxID=131310 RepID=A0A0N4ZE77_PARTI
MIRPRDRRRRRPHEPCPSSRRFASGHLFSCPSRLGFDGRDVERHGQGGDRPFRRRHSHRAHLRPGAVDQADGAGAGRSRRGAGRGSAYAGGSGAARAAGGRLSSAADAADRGAGPAGQRPVALPRGGRFGAGGRPARPGHRLFQPDERAGLRYRA